MADLQPQTLSTLTEFVIKAVQLGFLGFGALVFVMVFVILIRNEKPDASTARLRSRFLTIGFIAFLFAGAVQLVTPFVTPKPVVGTYKVSVAFSPKLSTAQLPEPTMMVLPMNTPVTQDKPFSLAQDAVLTVQIDDIIKQAQGLKATAQALSAANTQLNEQLEKSAAAAPAVAPIAPADAARLKLLSENVRANLANGDFAAAAVSADRAKTFTAAAAIRAPVNR
jgi:hypothetical protein